MSNRTCNWQDVSAISSNIITGVLQGGEKAGRTSLACKPIEYHVSHALAHIGLWIEGDMREPHLQHALTRLAIATSLDMLDITNGEGE